MEGRKVGLPTCLSAGWQERRKEGWSWGSGRTMKEEVKFNCNAFQIDLDDFNYLDPLSIYILMCIWSTLKGLPTLEDKLMNSNLLCFSAASVPLIRISF